MSNSANYSLFVYGTLRKTFQSPMYEYISRYFNFAGPGKVRGRLYDMGNNPAGVACEEMEFIIGELYMARQSIEFEWAIAQLDDYEGVKTEPGEVQLYRRELADIHLDDKIVKAWIYWFNGEVGDKPHVPSGDIVEYLKNR